MPTFYEILEKHSKEMGAVKDSRGNEICSMKHAEANVKVLENMMKTDGSYRGPRVNMEEALRAADASWLFPKVISDVLLRAKEPIMIGQNLFSKTINIDNVRSVEFPTMGAFRAFDMPDTGEYKEQNIAVTEHIVEIKTGKVGLMISLSEDLIKDSMWDLLALYVEQAGNAMVRKKEEKIFNEFRDKAHKVFDNNQTNSRLWTNGKAYNQARNYSVTFDDFIDTMGALVAHEYIPTDIVMHPLAWAVFAKDPIIRNIMYTQGQIGQSVWTSKPDFDQTANVPWAVSYQVSPFVPTTLSNTLTAGPASGLAACTTTDIYIVDRNQSIIVLQREGMSSEEFNNPMRDIVNLKVKERYGVGTVNGGRSAAAISNVRLEQNWAPTNAFISVTPS